MFNNIYNNAIPLARQRAGQVRAILTAVKYIVPDPDWLWFADGHDKFRNYGIGIYCITDA